MTCKDVITNTLESLLLSALECGSHFIPVYVVFVFVYFSRKLWSFVVLIPWLSCRFITSGAITHTLKEEGLSLVYFWWHVRRGRVMVRSAVPPWELETFLAAVYRDTAVKVMKGEPSAPTEVKIIRRTDDGRYGRYPTDSVHPVYGRHHRRGDRKLENMSPQQGDRWSWAFSEYRPASPT